MDTLPRLYIISAWEVGMFSIQDIIDTLCNIEVKGKENLDRLLGAILALEAMQQAEAKEEKAEVVTDG